MKHLLFYILFAFALYPLNILAEKVPVKLTCIVDSAYTQVSQWVYWFNLSENEYTIADSCFLEKGQKTFQLQYLLEEDNCLDWLTFSKAGPKQLMLMLAPGENVTIYLNTNTLKYPESKGSVGTQEAHELGLKIAQMHKNKRRLEDLLAKASEYSLQKMIIDSLSYYKKQFEQVVYWDRLRKTQSGKNYYGTLIYIRDAGMISKAQTDSLENVMLKRFPNSKSVERYFDHSPRARATERSNQAQDKYDALIGIHIPKSPKTNNSAVTAEKREYAIGRKVEDIILDGIDGKKKQLSEIKSKYILIDFWASWCGPCCQAYFDLLKVQEKFGKDLCIYAISIDNNLDAWQKAVERLDPKHSLIHVRASSGSEEHKVLNKQYGLAAIPTNFLLDENRKIIAINLLGDKLEKKISEIIGDNLSRLKY